MVEGILIGFGASFLLAVTVFLSRKEVEAKRVRNTQAHHMGASEYIMISMSLDNENVVVLLTEHEFNKARERALANPEDVWSNR